MDGNSARDEMFNIFKQTNLPDGAMTFQEQKALAMWVRLLFPFLRFSHTS